MKKALVYYLNFLAKLQLLKFKPTVIAITGSVGKTSFKDLVTVILEQKDKKIKSPYNTYINVGFPPGPIANPGLAAIRAAMYPTTTDYLYYIHDKTGAVHFARTIEDHDANIRKYLQ